MTLPAPLRFAAVLVLLLTSRLAHAGMAHLDCRFPMVFPGAAVNVVVLPYTVAGDNNSLTNLGNRLSLLVKLDVLSHILGYGSVGAVQMELPPGASPNDHCGPDRVLSVLLSARAGGGPPSLYGNPDAESTLRPGHGLVLVWGLLYEESDDIFVQTFARYLRRDVDETITIQAGGISFSARPSFQSLAFAPQKFSRSDLQKIEDSYRKASIVRDLPNDTARGDNLPILAAKCAGPDCDESAIHGAYFIKEKRGEWIHIQFMNPVQGQRKEGWVHAEGGLSGKPLDTILPELSFIEGAAGYLSLRVADAEKTEPQPGAVALAVNQLYTYVQANPAQPGDTTNAAALQLEGAAEYFAGHGQVDALSKAADRFERARALVPYDPNAITLAVSAQAAFEWKQKGRCQQTVQKSDRLSSALAFTSGKAALDNLANFYTLVQKAPPVQQPPPDKKPQPGPPGSLATPPAEELDQAAVAQRIQALKSVSLPM